jgi:hypothetical protein
MVACNFTRQAERRAGLEFSRQLLSFGRAFTSHRHGKRDTNPLPTTGIGGHFFQQRSALIEDLAGRIVFADVPKLPAQLTEPKSL